MNANVQRISGHRRLAAAALGCTLFSAAALAGCVSTGLSAGESAGPAAVPAAAAGGLSAFQPAALRLSGPPPAPQWADVTTRHRRALRDGEPPAEWRRMVAALQGMDARAMLDRANAEINRFPYTASERNWGRRDYWETPFELLANSGQCQDYAVAKYFLLRAAGFPAERLRLAVVRDGRADEDHAVLLAELHGQVLLLDNQIAAVVPAAQAGHYRPLYAVNENGWWLYGPAAAPAPRALAAFSRRGGLGY